MSGTVIGQQRTRERKSSTLLFIYDYGYYYFDCSFIHYYLKCWLTQQGKLKTNDRHLKLLTASRAPQKVGHLDCTIMLSKLALKQLLPLRQTRVSGGSHSSPSLSWLSFMFIFLLCVWWRSGSALLGGPL